MKIALFGYGKMGKKIASLAKERGDDVVAILGQRRESKDSIAEADVCIDFSHSTLVEKHLQMAIAAQKPFIIGTTGWDPIAPAVEKKVKQGGIGCLASANFSIGFHLFSQVVEEAARLFNAFDDYDVSGWEAHHRQKEDSPSGTAKCLTEILIANMDRKKNANYDRSESKIGDGELHFATLRCGSIPGSHHILFDSPIDTITLSHQARSRDGWALGALQAADWIQDKNGFFTMKDWLKIGVRPDIRTFGT